MRAAAAALALSLAAWGASAQPETRSEAQIAWDRGDPARAAVLWRREALAGSAEAALKLGQMHDLGRGVPRDRGEALRWYLEGAEAGLPEAQFNAAVLLDEAGRTAQAARWYARAAAGGHGRARYNLGLLFAAGDGVARNPDLARHWFEAATDAVPAAARAAIPEVERRTGFEPPTPLGAGVAGTRATFAWSAPPGPEPRPFVLEVIAIEGGAAGGVVARRETPASAVELELPATTGVLAWRVGWAGEDRAVAPSPWRRLEVAPPSREAPPVVAIRVARGDVSGLRLARELMTALEGRDVAVRLDRVGGPVAASAVAASGEAARALAQDIAAFMPVLSPGDVTRSASAEDVVVSIAGGLAAEPEPVAGEAMPARLEE